MNSLTFLHISRAFIPSSMNDNALFEYVGNLHIHSTFSDGTGTVPEIAQSASTAGLDFIILNDHDYLIDDLHPDVEGTYGRVRVLEGLEIGGSSHHYLAYNLKSMVKSEDSDPQEVIDKVNAQGGFGFLAHPFEKGMPFRDNSVAYTWNDLTVKGFSGICIWNFSSRWKERIKTAIHGLLFLLFKSRLLKGPSPGTLAFWDRLCRQRRVVAIGGSDAHGVVFKWGVFRFQPLTYDYLLNSINIHVLLDRKIPDGFIDAKTVLYRAMKEGRLFIANEKIAPAKGFRFNYLSDEGDVLLMGEEGPFQPGVIKIKTPEESEIRLIRNGVLHVKWYGKRVLCRLDQKGVYRVEVYRRFFFFGWRPWIFSNPIYLR